MGSSKMKCDECGSDISGSYFETGGKTVCKKDYEEKYQKKCSECHKSIEGTYYSKDDKFICEEDYKRINGDKMDCKMCGKKVEGEIIRAIGLVFHSDCFKCCICNRNLSGQEMPFTADKENRLYCQPCYNEKFAPRCFGCNEPIAPKVGESSAPRLTALDKDWHPSCFKCKDCGCVLNSNEGKKCYPKDNDPLCLDCNNKRK